MDAYDANTETRLNTRLESMSFQSLEHASSCTVRNGVGCFSETFLVKLWLSKIHRRARTPADSEYKKTRNLKLILRTSDLEWFQGGLLISATNHEQ